MEYEQVIALYRLTFSHLALPLILAAYFEHYRKKFDFFKYACISLPFLVTAIFMTAWRPTTLTSSWTGFSTWIFLPYILSVQSIFILKYSKRIVRVLQYSLSLFVSWFWLLHTAWLS